MRWCYWQVGQKVEELSKSPKSLKGLKNLQRPSVRRNVYRSTDPPSIRYEELELPLEFWQFFELFLLGPGALSIPFSNRLPTRQSEWSCWCSVAYFPRGARKIFELRTLESFTSYNQRSLCTKVCLQNARSPSTQILQMRSGRRRPSPESAWWLGGCWGSCAPPRPAIATNTCPRVTTRAGLPMSTNWKDTSQDSGGIAYVYRLTSHDLRGNKLQFDPRHCRLTRWAGGRMHLEVFIPTNSIVSVRDPVYTSKFCSSCAAA